MAHCLSINFLSIKLTLLLLLWLQEEVGFETQEASLKASKVADSKGAPYSPPKNDDDAEVDYPSQDGAQGDNSDLQALIAEFLS